MLTGLEGGVGGGAAESSSLCLGVQLVGSKNGEGGGRSGSKSGKLTLDF